MMDYYPAFPPAGAKICGLLSDPKTEGRESVYGICGLAEGHEGKHGWELPEYENGYPLLGLPKEHGNA